MSGPSDEEDGMSERAPRPEPPIGELVWSEYFKAWLIVVEYRDDATWWFVIAGQTHRGVAQARTPLSEMPGRA
jgi:hypothetical protein